jgi:hypothetical protein
LRCVLHIGRRYACYLRLISPQLKGC